MVCSPVSNTLSEFTSSWNGARLGASMPCVSLRGTSSSRLAMPGAYARHDAILRTVIAAHGGLVYKVIGDAMQAAFATAPDALQAALEAQRALNAEDWASCARSGAGPWGAACPSWGSWLVDASIRPISVVLITMAEGSTFCATWRATLRQAG